MDISIEAIGRKQEQGGEVGWDLHMVDPPKRHAPHICVLCGYKWPTELSDSQNEMLQARVVRGMAFSRILNSDEWRQETQRLLARRERPQGGTWAHVLHKQDRREIHKTGLLRLSTGMISVQRSGKRKIAIKGTRNQIGALGWWLCESCREREERIEQCLHTPDGQIAYQHRKQLWLYWWTMALLKLEYGIEPLGTRRGRPEDLAKPRAAGGMDNVELTMLAVHTVGKRNKIRDMISEATAPGGGAHALNQRIEALVRN